jgi:uncharacterized membrane protein YcfT
MANIHPPSNSRVDWIDYAKGICIFAVVTLYATREVQDITQVKGWMQHVVDFAQPFRMPDFFLIAGLLVPRVIDRPWRSYIDTKILYFVYFYAVWVTFSFVYREVHGLLGPDSLALLPDYLRLYYIGPPYGPLWFIYILALFFIVIRLVRPLPVPLVLAGAVALQVANLHTGVALLDRFALYFVFFYSGYVFARYLFPLADWAQTHVRWTLGIFVLWFAANAMLVKLDLASVPGISLLLGYAGAGAVMLLSTLFARVSWMRWLRYLGQHSIVVYLGFIIPMRVMLKFLVDRKVIHDIGTLSLAVTLGSVAGAVLLYWALRNTPLRFLYSRPVWTSIQASGKRLIT